MNKSGFTSVFYKNLIILSSALVLDITVFYLIGSRPPNHHKVKCIVSIFSELSEIDCFLPGMSTYFDTFFSIRTYSVYISLISLLYVMKLVFFFLSNSYRVGAIAPVTGNIDMSKLQNIPIEYVFFLDKLKQNVSSILIFSINCKRNMPI